MTSTWECGYSAMVAHQYRTSTDRSRHESECDRMEKAQSKGSFLIGDICNAAMTSTISGVKRRFGFLTTLRLQGLQPCPLFLRLLNTSCKLRISKLSNAAEWRIKR